MKILFIECSDFYSFPIGGQLSYLRSLIASIDVEPYLVGISLNDRHKIGQWTKRNINGAEFPFFSVGTVGEKSPLDKFVPFRARFVLWLYKFREHILSSGANAIFVQTQESALPFLKYIDIPIVLRLAGATNPLRGSRFFWARFKILEHIYELCITRCVLPRVTKVIGINSECEELCNRLGVSNYEYIALGVDQSIFFPHNKKLSKEKIGFDPNVPVFIFVGRLSQIKGIGLLIDAFSKVLGEFSQAKLLIVGDGEERQNIEKVIYAKGLENSIRMVGSVSRDQLPNLLNASDVFVITSLAEGVPNAMLEAMACGLPVVATSVGGIPEVIKTGFNGILVHTRNSTEVAEGMITAYRKSHLLGTGALSTISESYSMKNVAEAIRRMFEEAIASSAK